MGHKCVSLFYILILEVIHSQNITQYIDAFNIELKELFCNGLSVGGDKCDNDNYGIQDYVYSLSDHFETDDIEITSIAEEIIKDLDNKLNLRASFLTNMSNYIQQSCVQYGYSDYSNIEAITDFDNLAFSGNSNRAANLPSDIQYNSVYNQNLSLSQSTYKLPNGIDYENENIQKDAQISLLLDNVMMDLYDKYCTPEGEYCMMYFGTINGLFRQYPGVESSKNGDDYADYDPRFRPWYVSAAAGSKKLLF